MPIKKNWCKISKNLGPTVIITDKDRKNFIYLKFLMFKNVLLVRFKEFYGFQQKNYPV